MKVRIASLYFVEVHASRPLYGGDYRIPAVPKGGDPVFLQVPDLIQRSQEPSPDGKTKVTNRYLIDGREIAADILREWTRDTFGMTPQCCPGIFMVREQLPVIQENGMPQFDGDNKPLWRDASTEEKESMWREDLANARKVNDAWGQHLISEGDRLNVDPKERVMISPLSKDAARYYGKERDWLQELRDGDIKKCQFCTKSVSVTSMVCEHCHQVIDYVRYAEEVARRDAAVEQAKAAAATAVMAPPLNPKGRPHQL